MKTQCPNLNEVVTTFSGTKCFLYNHFIEKGIIKDLSELKLSKDLITHYALLIFRAASKELLGADLDIKLLIILAFGYVVSAKDFIVQNPAIQKIKTFKFTQQQQLAQMKQTDFHNNSISF